MVKNGLPGFMEKMTQLKSSERTIQVYPQLSRVKTYAHARDRKHEFWDPNFGSGLVSGNGTPYLEI